MRATTTPTPSTRTAARSRGAAAGLAAAAVALSLVPGSASAQQADAAPVEVSLELAGQAPVEVATTPQVWPGQVLEAHGVAVDGNDLVAVLRDGDKVHGQKKKVRQGDVVRLTDVVKERKTKIKKVRKGTVEVFTTKLKPGKRKVVSTGRAGQRKIVAVKTLHDGEPVSYRVVKRKLVKESRPRRVLVGREAWSVPGADGLNWGALANCESGGNPRAVNPAGYYGLYQFDTGTWRSVGGSGLPTSASAAEQTYRAKLLYQQRGRSPWPTCGRLL
ncbi:resuscitation-promoting factor [Nocardioides palaemonis]|uniref:resuscitation-promoting factor n=1 Tax=Nocardioides palaemonis TaxID=2829810 RepID=UPI0027DE4AF5|nr:resuscitation-promoting factor [Nocardioides palaemonis]